ncbi:glycerophosphodiester phosphodiesterase [Aurantivibrio plasticivorans]
MHKPHRLTCFAHRGGRSIGVENALETIEKALALGVDGVEIDIWLAGGQLIVTHDRRLGRTVKGEGSLLKLSTDEVASLRHYDDSPVATLKEVLELIGQRARLNIEIKGPGCASPIVELLTNYCQQSNTPLDNYIISSFDHRQLQQVKQRLPDVPIGALVDGILLDLAACAESLGAISLHAAIDFLSDELIDDAKNRGLKVYVYTVNEVDDFEDLMNRGVDGVFTDFPERLLEFNKQL